MQKNKKEKILNSGVMGDQSNIISKIQACIQNEQFKVG